MMLGHISLMDSDLQSIRSPVDSSAALIRTLIDVGKLFPGNSIQAHDNIEEDIGKHSFFTQWKFWIIWNQDFHCGMMGRRTHNVVTKLSIYFGFVMIPKNVSIIWYCCCHNLYKCAYPFGLNLFFQPGLGPGFFLTLDSSGVFGLRLLLWIVPFRALAEKFKRITPGLLTAAIFSTTYTDTHLLSEYGSNGSSSDIPSFLLSSSSSSEMTLHTHAELQLHVIQNWLNTHIMDVS